jgi:translation elongation factor EF-Ts
MPSVSAAQQIAMAIAEHNPSKLYKRNKGLKKMSKKSLHEFASTKRTGLPGHIAENITNARSKMS